MYRLVEQSHHGYTSKQDDAAQSRKKEPFGHVRFDTCSSQPHTSNVPIFPMRTQTIDALDGVHVAALYTYMYSSSHDRRSPL